MKKYKDYPYHKAPIRSFFVVFENMSDAKNCRDFFKTFEFHAFDPEESESELKDKLQIKGSIPILVR